MWGERTEDTGNEFTLGKHQRASCGCRVSPWRVALLKHGFGVVPHWRRNLTWGSVGDGQRVVVCAPPAMPQPKGHLHLNAQERGGLGGGPRVQRHDVGLEEGPHEQGREAHTNDPNRNAYLITRWGKTSHLGTYLTPAVWFGRCWEWQIEKRFMFTTGHRRSTNASSVCTRRR